MCLFSNFLFQFSDLIFKISVEDFGFENPFSSPRIVPVLFTDYFLYSQQPSFLATHSLSYHLEYTVVLLGFYSCILLLLLVLFHGWQGSFNLPRPCTWECHHGDIGGAQTESHRVWVESGPLSQDDFLSCPASPPAAPLQALGPLGPLPALELSPTIGSKPQPLKGWFLPWRGAPGHPITPSGASRASKEYRAVAIHRLRPEG